MELANNNGHVPQNTVAEDDRTIPGKPRLQGGLRTMPFILANEVCDKFATTGFHANMITYLTQQLNLPMVRASNILSIFSGASSITPLIGAFLADSYIGRFWTISIGSVIYELGLLSITTTATFPALHPPPCSSQGNCTQASSLHLGVLYISLLLTSIGAGGIRPCVVIFAADQFDMSRKGVASRKWNIFNWHLFVMSVAVLAALTLIVYVQDKIGWSWGFGIPTLAMGISIIAFVLGHSLYVKIKPQGSPILRLAQVIVAAVKKRKEPLPKDPNLLYQDHELDAPIASQGRLLHTTHFKCLDKAAIVTDEDAKNPSKPDLWRLSSVHRIEELKSVIRILPIWAASILVVASSSHLGSFVVLQAQTMDRHLSHSFEIPAASLSIFSVITVLVGVIVYERLFIPFVRRFTGNPSGITCLRRMGIGMGINILTYVVASLVEKKRKAVAAQHNLLDDPQAIIPISVFWLVPQYFVHGVGEVFVSVGHMEFLYDQSPESMRTAAVALFWIASAMGQFAGTFLVSMVHKYTDHEGNWLPDWNINRGKLENFYLLVSLIQTGNLVYYLICAWFYTPKPLEEISEVSKEQDLELAEDKVSSRKLDSETNDNDRQGKQCKHH